MGTHKGAAIQAGGDALYPIETLMESVGMGLFPMREARKRGLKVHKIGRRVFVFASDFLAFVRAEGDIPNDKAA